MAKQILQDLQAAVDRNTEVVGSAITLINGIATRIQTAIDQALSNGATEQELEPLTREVEALNANADALAAAVQSNT